MRLLAILLLAAVPAAAFAQPAAPAAGDAAKRIRVAVLELDAVGASEPQASAITDRLQDALHKSGRFELVDRNQIEKVLKEQAFQQGACTTPDCAAKAGKILGVDRIVTGRVSRINANVWQIAVELIDVESAETVATKSLPHQGDYFSLLNVATPQLAQQLSNSGGGAFAATPVRVRAACKADVTKLCAQEKSGGGRILQCLRRHRNELSPACVTALQERQDQMRSAEIACRADSGKFCADVQRGGGRIEACLRQHAAELSRECAAYVK